MLGCVFAFALAPTAGAQLLNHKDLSASIAITIAQTAIETCKANGYAVSATVVVVSGELNPVGPVPVVAKIAKPTESKLVKSQAESGEICSVEVEEK